MPGRVARQSAWALGASASNVVVQTAATAWLARWLAPEAFGSFALVTMVTAAASVLSQLGLGAALVQAKRLEDGDAGALLGLSLGVGLALCAGLALAAPSLGALFANDVLPALLTVQGLTLVLMAPTGVAFALLQRRLAYAVLARLQVANVLVYGVCAVGLASAGFGAWALVLGRVVADAVMVGPALRCAGLSPWPRLDWPRARRFVRFGGQVTATHLFLIAGAHMDTALVGALAGAGALGYYTLAFGIVMLPASRLASVVKGVAFAALAREQGEGEAFQRNAASLLQHLSVLCAPLVAGLAYTSHDALAVLLGPGWEESARLLSTLAPAAVVAALGSGMGAIVLARGHAHVEMGFALLRIVVMGAGIAVGVTVHGAWGAAAAVSLYHVVAFPLFYFVLMRWGGMGIGAITGAIAPGLVCAVAMALPVFQVQTALADAGPLARLAASAGTGALAYAALLRLAFPGAWRGLRGTFAGLLARSGRGRDASPEGAALAGQNSA